jgi:hypothetical protein
MNVMLLVMRRFRVIGFLVVYVVLMVGSVTLRRFCLNGVLGKQ